MFTWLKKKPTSKKVGPEPVEFSAGLSHGILPEMPLTDRAGIIARAESAAVNGNLEQAAQAYELAVALDPNDAALLVVFSATLIRQEKHALANIQLNRAILLDPANAYAFFLLGKNAQEQGHFSEAIENFNEALEIKPDFEAVFGELATAHMRNGRPDAARQCFLNALNQFPNSALFHFRLGMLYADGGNVEQALRCYDSALLNDPACAEVHWFYGQALQLHGLIEPALRRLRKSLLLNPDLFAANSTLLWLLSFHGEAVAGQYLVEAQQYGAKVLARAKPFTALRRDRGDGNVSPRLRVGLVSGDMRAHPVGYFLEGVLKALNPSKIELIAYSMNQQDDEVTERIKGCFPQWTSIVALSDEAAACKIFSDEVDILIDVSGHSAYNRLPVFAWKPASVQISWLGYLASTGVPGMDYVFADTVAVPDAVQHQFTESVWYLPETFNCFTPPVENPALAVAMPPVLSRGYITFGSFQRINKLSDSTLSLWGRVLRVLPEARLCLRNGEAAHPKVRASLLDRLARAGIAPARVILEGAIRDRGEYLATYAQVDIILDTPVYPGTTTTCEALWMGVPTLTLAGDTMLTRVGASLLTCAGLSEWVAVSEDEYVSLAQRHGSDIDGLAELRAGLRQRVASTPLFDAHRFAPKLEDALLAIWRRKTACSNG